jgi:hypothetical protein
MVVGRSPCCVGQVHRCPSGARPTRTVNVSTAGTPVSFRGLGDADHPILICSSNGEEEEGRPVYRQSRVTATKNPTSGTSRGRALTGVGA